MGMSPLYQLSRGVGEDAGGYREANAEGWTVEVGRSFLKNARLLMIRRHPERT